MIRETSKAAYREIKSNGLLSKLRWKVYDTIFHFGPMTAQETWHFLRDKENRKGSANGITPRFSELKKLGVLREVEERSCKITGHIVIAWDVTKNLPIDLPKKLTRNQRIEMAIKEVKDLYKNMREDVIGLSFHKKQFKEVIKKIKKI